MIKAILHPFTIYLLTLGLALFLYVLKYVKGAGIVFITSVLWLLLTSMGFLPKLLVRSLESRYDSFKITGSDTMHYDILVLGGGHTDDAGLPPNAQLNITALGRLVEGIRIYRLLPNSRLILSGYSPADKTIHAVMLKRTALSLGVDEHRIALQTKPTDTYEEAKFYKNTFGSNHQLILVTSATHIYRAMQMFKMFGIKPYAAPTNFLSRPYRLKIKDWLPSAKNMDDMHTALKEYVALWAAKWRY